MPSLARAGGKLLRFLLMRQEFPVFNTQTVLGSMTGMENRFPRLRNGPVRILRAGMDLLFWGTRRTAIFGPSWFRRTTAGWSPAGDTALAERILTSIGHRTEV